MRNKFFLIIFAATAFSCSGAVRVTGHDSKYKEERTFMPQVTTETAHDFTIVDLPEMPTAFVAPDVKRQYEVRSIDVKVEKPSEAVGFAIDRRVSWIDFIITSVSGHRLLNTHIDPGLA